MRIILVALTMALAVALLAIPAHAQRTRGGGKPQSAAGQQQSAEQKRKAAEDDKAAKAAIERLPDKKFDPWRTMR
jgi:hypothetical protein